MIQSREDYLFFLKADELALNISQTRQGKFIAYITHEIWHFQRLLRKLEYNKNCRLSLFWKPYVAYLHYRVARYGRKLGFEVHPNVFGPGLGIAHIGTLIINKRVRVGENCRIHSCTYLATQATGKDDDCPTLGNNVFIGPCTVIVGKIHIADNIAVGANSFVAQSFEEEGITIAGAPAKKVSDKGSFGLCSYQRATDVLRQKKHA